MFAEFHLVGHFVEREVELGGLAGAAVGVAVVVVVFLLAGLTSLPSNGWWRHAYLTPFFESIASFVVDFLPSDIARHIRYS
ncbi:MAG: hypothetical protein IH808_07480 [Proteobacteria bacterium]|nr:hypothetical protein [Pseudomonadota bacterium]